MRIDTALNATCVVFMLIVKFIMSKDADMINIRDVQHVLSIVNTFYCECLM